jgi:hypothetical protein
VVPQRIAACSGKTQVGIPYKQVSIDIIKELGVLTNRVMLHSG